ncbi:uncharacterized protein LOC142536753 isoform X1 [Primulina tabacum]|uniref:uncharacterized protein LOC142536753 isoform X1 n=1 Tax=Primulina tabacum TaxID=48773 RepID=UPI003F596563
MQFFKAPSKSKSKSKISIRLILLITSCSLCAILYISCNFISTPTENIRFSTSQNDVSSPMSLEHLVFGIASNQKSWINRKNYVKLWWRPQEMKGCVFVEENIPPSNTSSDLPPICVSGDTTRFRYTYRNGLRSAIRVARVVSETFALNHSNVRWFVFGDDDTVFFPENLVKILSKYDHGLWYYIGTNSESFVQNKLFSYEMAFGGAGFAISYPLAKVLAKIFDPCLERYPHLYGSDGRIHACVTELGVVLTHEPGFHQIDFRGNMFGFLASHPLSPLVSLHHLDATDPIFPNMTTINSLHHLFQAVTIDSQRILQQTVCYDRWFSWTISISWGYAIQIFPRNVNLHDALRTRETYVPWRKGGGANNLYGVDTAGLEADPCRRPPVFFLDKVWLSGDRVRSSYRRMYGSENCAFDTGSPRKLEQVMVFSQKMELDSKQLHAPRRHCCDVMPSTSSSSSSSKVMEISIRECGDEEIIYMHS